jgi:ubiquinone/menaquinone biosynthesis C-methylase UbiE
LTRVSQALTSLEVAASDSLKDQVREFWNEQSCDTQVAKAARFSREYFQEIEDFRYRDQPFIHSFAQFTRYRGARVLEVGFGAGTDFAQWLRAGARASGVDLTPEALENVRRRIEVCDLPPPESLQVADAEQLPFQANQFDLAYSFGVIHHSPDTRKALHELARVVRPGGELKIMVYNRYSITIVNRWIRFALLKGQPWRDLRWVLTHKVENPGTKGYTRNELMRMFEQAGLGNIKIRTEITSADYLSSSAFRPLNWVYRRMIQLAGWRFDWRAEDYVERTNEPGPRVVSPPRGNRTGRRSLTGNPLGFYHCISAVKA